ncbi:hypothetical protein COJ46_21900 [Bacillus sp. AFS077874]|uniref:hypothetical protein n=1 Tax=unclassified Bacillus (in: firmicutes) TaxID=185979 RepID=UPI000BF3BFDA|nr:MULTISPECIES: hypothetical protein [unclassified Bacillus (in: firmicutes)]PET71578.1 hypothetical protein CN514_06615 [Bacillus sp. AFS001701]PFM75319.1 hypothetical protein COJ46_21900 [Bacillus sp. AFS077874]
MMKKIVFSLLVVITALTSKVGNSFAAGEVSPQLVYGYNCSDTWTVCVAIQTGYGDKSGISPQVYIPYGARVDINGDTFTDSLFNMRFYVIDSAGKAVANTTVNPGPFNGTDYISWTNKQGGYYRLQAICFGNNPSYKCEGEGKISFTRQ